MPIITTSALGFHRHKCPLFLTELFINTICLLWLTDHCINKNLYCSSLAVQFDTVREVLSVIVDFLSHPRKVGRQQIKWQTHDKMLPYHHINFTHSLHFIYHDCCQLCVIWKSKQVFSKTTCNKNHASAKNMTEKKKKLHKNLNTAH